MKYLSRCEVRFADYLLFVAKAGDNPRGDFIRDAHDEIAAGRFPTDNTWAAVLAHVRGGCPEAQREARRLWSEYSRRDWWSAQVRKQAQLRKQVHHG